MNYFIKCDIYTLIHYFSPVLMFKNKNDSNFLISTNMNLCFIYTTRESISFFKIFRNLFLWAFVV